MTKNNKNSAFAAAKCGLLFALVLLSSCRMPVIVTGEGFVYGAFARALYENGYLFDIQEDFDEKFWPVPAPGNSFKWWSKICKGRKPLCRLTLGEELWGLDDEMPLKVVFEPGYHGPLRLRNYSYIWNPNTNLLRILRNSIELEGVKSGAPIRYFAATTDLEVIVPARVRPTELEFQFPDGVDIDNIAMFLSTVDTDGVLASVGPTFGIAPELSEIELTAYNPSSKYADVLVDCVRVDGLFGLCDMQTLPYLGLNAENPTIPDIMQRTVVSHNWMGKNFRSVLQALPEDFLKQFRGVTAVVIAANIRPSFFNPITGVIHIDPWDLWLSQGELATISEEPDFRSGFGSELRFFPHWEYELDGFLAWAPYDPETDPPFRSVEQILWPLSTVLIHELAHANDAAPPGIQPQLDPSATPLSIYLELQSETPSANLDNTYPLSSSLLTQIADVLFGGETPSEQLKAFSGEEIGEEFAADVANDLYNFFTSFEDTAMLVEEVLSYHFFGIRRVVAFLEVPENPSTCNDFIVGWGQRSRASEPQIQERARLVLTGLLDEANVDLYLDDLPAPYTLDTGVGWCDSFIAMPNNANIKTGASALINPANSLLRGIYRIPQGPFHQKQTPLSGKTFLRQGGGGIRY